MNIKMKYKHILHRENQFRHAMYRAKERYGLELTVKDLKKLYKDIVEHKHSLIFSYGDACKLYKGIIKNESEYVVVDRKLKSIVTLLSLDLVIINLMNNKWSHKKIKHRLKLSINANFNILMDNCKIKYNKLNQVRKQWLKE